jgi:hypothetical protein
MREGRKKTEHEDKTLPGNASKKIVREREGEKEGKWMEKRKSMESWNFF